MKRFIQVGSAAAALFLSLTVYAQAPPESPTVSALQGLNSSLEQLTRKITPAVVHIEVVGYGSSGNDNEDDQTRNQTLMKERGSGSGVIVDPDGYIVTAYHVIEGARRIRVELDPRPHFTSPNGDSDDYMPKSMDATIVGTFKDADVAVLKIDSKNLPVISFSPSDSLKQGQLVAALGSPEGLRNSLSLGVVSAVARQVEPDDYMTYIQTDASQAPGSSGAPLVNIQGEMVGMTVFSLVDRGRREGLGFAVPSQMVKLVYDRIRKSGGVSRPYLRVEIQGITPTLATALRLPSDSGVIIAGAANESSSEKDSLQAGDVLLSFDGTRVRNVPQLNWALLHKRVGDLVTVEVWRRSKTLALDISLAETPDAADSLSPIRFEENLVAKLGIVGSAPRGRVEGTETGTPEPGVTVVARLRESDVQPELVAGDVICSLNAVPITSVTQLRQMLDGYKPGDAIALHVIRKGKPMYVAFEID